MSLWGELEQALSRAGGTVLLEGVSSYTGAELLRLVRLAWMDGAAQIGMRHI